MSGHEPIPDATLRALARSFHAQGRAYGFAVADYLRFVNLLLELSMEAHHAEIVAPAAALLPVQGDTVAIRAWTPADREALERWLADPDGRWFLQSRATRLWMGVDELLDDPDNLIGVIEHEGRAVGAMGFLQIDRQQRRAELRKVIGEPALRGQGLGTEATRLWVGYGLRRLGLRKIYLYTLASHQANVRLNEQLGFRVEGVLHREVRIDGVDHDLLRMAMVRAEATPGVPLRR